MRLLLNQKRNNKQQIEEKKKPTGSKTLIADDPDLPISNLNKVIEEVHNKTQKEYLTEIDILSKYDVYAKSEKERVAEAKTVQSEKPENDPE